MLKKEV